MPRQTIENRVEALELQVSELRGEGDRVPRIESQIVQLHTEMHDGFSAIHTEMRDRFAAVDAEFVAVRTEMRERFAAVDAEFVAVRREMREGVDALRVEIRTGDEETRRFMRVLHEDLVGRIATIRKG